MTVCRTATVVAWGAVLVLVGAGCSEPAGRPAVSTAGSGPDTLISAGRLHRSGGGEENLRQANALFRQAAAAAEAEGQGWAHSSALIEIGVTFFHLQAFDSALAYSTMAHEVAERAGTVHNSGAALLNAAEVHRAVGNRDSAEVYYRRAERVFGRSPDYRARAGETRTRRESLK
jgi:tetratricopeptide (TPR) repeat protein